MKSFLKNSNFFGSKLRIFLVVNFSMGSELVFLLPFVYYELKLLKFCGVKYKIELKFLQKNILTSRKISLKVNKIMQNIPYSHKTSILDNSSKKKRN